MSSFVRWALFVGIYFYAGFCVVVLFGLFVAWPVLDWYVNKISYTLPPIDRTLRTSALVMACATVFGSYAWLKDRIAARRFLGRTALD